MAPRPVPLSEFIAEMSEGDQAWVAEESARLIAEEYARRAALKSRRAAAIDDPPAVG